MVSDLHILGPTGWLFLMSLVSIFFLLQRALSPRWLLWLNESVPAFVICCQVSGRQLSWASVSLLQRPLVFLPAVCSAPFFPLINAYVLTEWPFSNRVTEWLMCLVVFSPPDLPRRELIGVCSLLQSDSPTRYPLHQALITTQKNHS